VLPLASWITILTLSFVTAAAFAALLYVIVSIIRKLMKERKP